MGRTDDINVLPANLPVPEDDGAAAHLAGRRVPDFTLIGTGGDEVNLAALPGRTVVYCYPRTGRPNEEPPQGWNQIPGARGCTPQSCAFRDHHAELAKRNTRVFGLSTQTTAYQREAVERLHLPFALLSDTGLEFADALHLPRFETAGMTLLKRLTLVVRDGTVEHAIYPVFPPDRNAEAVLAWLDAHPED